jgi:RNA polymerase sigma-70 factor (ECF subfamily)
MAPSRGSSLVGLAKAGDNTAFEALLEPLITPGYRLALGLLHDHAAAEDAVQDAAVLAWRKIRNLRDGAEMRPWFFGIVAHQCRSAQRSRWWSVVKLPDPVSPSDGANEAVVQGADLRSALLKLRHDDRLALVLFYYLDLPIDEVAAACGSSRAGVKKRIQRIVHRLRPNLQVEGTGR